MAQLIVGSHGPGDNLSWLQTLWGGPIQRIFWINNVPIHQSRGGHRHPTCQMALHCPAGSVTIYVQTPLEDRWYQLDSTTHYLLLDPQDWRLMYNFSPDAILVVFAEQAYDLTPYIDRPYRLVPTGR